MTDIARIILTLLLTAIGFAAGLVSAALYTQRRR